MSILECLIGSAFGIAICVLLYGIVYLIVTATAKSDRTKPFDGI